MTKMDYPLDILAKDLDVVFCGLNPTVSAVASGHNYSNRSNHFWSVLHLAGFTDVCLEPRQERDLLKYGCGLTTIVSRPTNRSFEVQADEFKLAWPAFQAKMRHYAPKVVAFLGKRGASIVMGERELPWGRQPVKLSKTITWVLPNPRGPGRSFSLEALVQVYSDFRVALAQQTRSLTRPLL